VVFSFIGKTITHSPEFKANFDMDAISGSKTLQKFATDGAERLIQVSW
jgi:hypothetical protein